MHCRHCHSQTSGQLFCPSCGSLVPPQPAGVMSHFALFGLPPTFQLSTQALEQQYRDLSLKLHPDRFAGQDAAARRISLEHTTQLNEAYKTLKNPIRRAFYLLKLHGVDLDKEEQGPGDPKLKAFTQPSFEFLEEVMELRETLSNAKQQRDYERAAAMGEQVRQRQEANLREAELALETLDKSAGDEAALKKAAQALSRVRYFTRFLEEVAAIEEEALS